jgi:hypothetical protein
MDLQFTTEAIMPNTTTHLIGQDQAKLNERAMNAFMLMQVSISSHKGFKPQILAVTKFAKATKVADEAKRMAEILAVLGPLQKPIDEVIAAQSLLRTYLYRHTLTFSQARSEDGHQAKGERLVYTSKVPEVYTMLKTLAHNADNLVRRLQHNWNDMREEAMNAVRDVKFSVPKMDISGDQLASRFKITVSNPRLIPETSLAQMSLPAGLAQQFERDAVDSLTAKLEGAKAQALEGALTHMNLIVRQLTSGTRLSPSLVEHAKTHSETMRGMVEGYDNDPRIIQMCDDIDKHIASATTERWREDSTSRDAALTVAKSVSKNLTAITAPVTPSPVTQQAGGDLAGGLMADLID